MIDRLYPPVGQEFRFPIPIELAQDELEMALDGKFVTRVIYLEEPKAALPVAQKPDDQSVFEVSEGDNPLEVADTLGRPVAILRLGGRVPGIEGPDDAFMYGSPPLVKWKPAAPSKRRATDDRAARDVATAVESDVGFAVEAGQANSHHAGADRARAERAMTRLLRLHSSARRISMAVCLAAIALACCSCRTGPFGSFPMPAPQPESVDRPSSIVRELPELERTPHVPLETVEYQGLPVPMTNLTPWSPPGIEGPWPHDEFLKDGGDREVQVNVNAEGQLQGLELEDTVAVYDTDRRRHLHRAEQPGLSLCTAVRGRAAGDKHLGKRTVRPVASRRPPRGTVAGARRPAGDHGRAAGAAGGRNRPQAAQRRTCPRARQRRPTARQPVADLGGGLAMHEDLRILRQGVFEESEKARLVELVDAAIVWSHEKAVQVVLDGTAAVSVATEQKAQETFRVDVPNHPCLRVIKTASTKWAKPGDIVEFTIRFDNMGDQAIEHVTLIDNLTTRLEYVPGSAQSSREADFSTEVNEGDSLVLRWDFKDPLPFGSGGLVRFQCRVR